MAAVNYEIVYKIDGVTSWIYFHSVEGKSKAAGEKKFKQVVRDSGWTKRAKLVRIRKIVKAIDPPLTKAQKNALRSRKGSTSSANSRRPRASGKPPAKSKKVPQTVPSTSLSRLLDAGPPRSAVPKDKLSQNKRDSGKGRTGGTPKSKTKRVGTKR